MMRIDLPGFCRLHHQAAVTDKVGPFCRKGLMCDDLVEDPSFPAARSTIVLPGRKDLLWRVVGKKPAGGSQLPFTRV